MQLYPNNNGDYTIKLGRQRIRVTMDGFAPFAGTNAATVRQWKKDGGETVRKAVRRFAELQRALETGRPPTYCSSGEPGSFRTWLRAGKPDATRGDINRALIRAAAK